MISISCHSSINGHGSVLERSKTVPRGAQGGARMSTSEPPLAPRGAPRKPATGPNKVPIWLHDASRWRQYWPRCCPKTVPSSNTGLLLFLPLLILLLMLFLLHPIPPPCEGGSTMGGGLEIPPLMAEIHYGEVPENPIPEISSAKACFWSRSEAPHP